MIHELIGSALPWMAAMSISLAGITTASAQDRANKPNIVLFIADDYSWHDSGAYGSTDARTPNIDKLATQGMTFNHAFAASPTCSPSRSAIYTGLMPMRNGAHSNHTLIREDVQSLPHYLQALGYRVVLAGKTHIGPREQFPFEYLSDSNIMPPGRKHVLWTDLNTAATDKLLAEHDPAQPLCLIVAAHSPHVYWVDNDGYDPAALKLPPFLIDTPETREIRCKYLSDVTKMDTQLGEVCASLEKHGYAKNTLLAFTADQGAQWPFGKWNLYDEGIRAPLIVRWPGHVEAGARSDAMTSLVDLLPTFVDAAGGKAIDHLDGRSMLSVLTGTTNRLRDEVYTTHTGDKEMNRTPMRSVRTSAYKYIINLKPETRYTTHISEGNGPDGRVYWDTWVKKAEHDAEAKAIIDRYRHRPAEELYDIRADPYELKNLAEDPASYDKLIELREKVRAWRLEQGEDLDNVLMPEDGRTGALKYAG